MDAPMAGRPFMDISSSMALGTVEMSMQFVTGYIIPLPSPPTGQGNSHIADKVYPCERRALWQQVHYHEFHRLKSIVSINLVALIV
jgi:hypothetical protein